MSSREGITVVLVRHADPAATPDADPRRWPLSAEGRAAARRLQERLPSGLWVASTETKARETLELAAGGAVPVPQDEGFDEVRREGEPFGEHFQAGRYAWIAGRHDERHTGWETRQQAADRFEDAVRRHAPDAAEGVLVVGTHGMVLTAWLVLVARRLDPEHATRFWTDLRLPDVIEVR